MTIEHVGMMAFRLIKEEAIRCNAGNAERLGQYVRGVVRLNNDIVNMLSKEQFRVNSSFKGGFTHNEIKQPVVYTDTDSVKEEKLK